MSALIKKMFSEIPHTDRELLQMMREDPLVLGEIYEKWSQEYKKGRDDKVSNEEVGKNSQYFTKDYMIWAILQNTIGRYFYSYCSSKGYPVHELDGDLFWGYSLHKEHPPIQGEHHLDDFRDLRVADICCGAGNFLILTRIYILELSKFLVLWGEAPISEFDIFNMIRGYDIDRDVVYLACKAYQISCGFQFSMDELGYVFQVADHPFGTLGDSAIDIEDGTLHVAFGNPPYLSTSKLKDSEFSKFLKKRFPHGYKDLCTAFVYRNMELCRPFGYTALLTAKSWYYLMSFAEARYDLLTNKNLLAVFDYRGKSHFPGVCTETMTSVFQNKPPKPGKKTTALRFNQNPHVSSRKGNK